MKLRLPKGLLVAVIAAVAMPTVWADDDTHWDITSSEYTTTATTISNGTTFYLGNGTDGGAGSGDASTVFTSGKFTIENGGVLRLHGWTGSERTINTDGKQQIASDIEIQGGGTLQLQDGSYYFSQNVNVTGTAENSSVIYSTYDKGFVFNDLTGEETAVLELQMGTWSPNTFTLQGIGAYAGSLKVGNRDGQTMYLAINSDQALASTASVHLMKSGSYLALNTASLTLSSISSNEGSIILAKDAKDSIIGSATPVESAKVIISNDGNTTDAFTGSIGAGVTLELAAGSSQAFGQITNNGTIIVNGNAKYNLLSIFEYDYDGVEMIRQDTDGSTTSGNGFYSYSGDISLFKEESTGSSNISSVYYEGTAYTVTDGKVTVEDSNYNIYYIGGTGSASTVDAAKITAADNGTTLQTVVVEATGSLTGLDHSTGDLTVNGIISGDVNVTGGVLTVNSVNALSGDNVNITNGELKVSFNGDNNSAISHNTTVSVGAGGTLRLDGHDSIGWSASQAPKLITLAGEEGDGNLATMVINDANSTTTWCAPVEMNGYSKISGTKINLLEGPTLTVTNTDNVIDISTIQLRSNMNVYVEENGALEITSLLERHSNAGSNDKLIKTGGGTLTLKHANATYQNGTEIQGGTIVVKAGKALGTGDVTIYNNATLDLEQVNADYALGSINMNDGSTLIVRNGYYRNNFNSAINIDGNVNLQSGWGGDGGIIASNINGKGSMSMSNPDWNNSPTSDAWKISGVISDKSETEKLSVINVSAVATFSGSNTYSGGTTVNGGTLTTANESALGTGKVTMNSGTLTQSTALSISAMDYNGGTVNNNGQDLTVTGTVKIADNTTMTIEGAGANDIGTLELGAGLNADTYALTTTGTLTLGSLSLDLSDYGTGVYKLVSTAGLTWTDGSYTTTGLADGLTAQVGYAEGSSSNLILTIGEATTPDSTDWSILDAEYSGGNNGTLTLTVGADLLNYDFTNDGAIIIPGIDDAMMKDILGLTVADADGMVGITLKGADGETVTAAATGQVGFQGKDGIYFGENVGGAWQYQVAYIPEPATATLSLLALAGLAARRRRK